MNQKIKPEGIDRSQRLGNPKKSITAKPRPIIVKYVTYNTRNIIYRNKKVVKGKGISVTESLTAKRNCKGESKGTAWICYKNILFFIKLSITLYIFLTYFTTIN